MDIQAENVLKIKRHNRRIVQRVFHKSSTNANYQFPRQQLAQSAASQIGDVDSLKSKLSQMYDLYQQNIKHHDEQLKSRKIISVQQLLNRRKPQTQTNRHWINGDNQININPLISFPANKQADQNQKVSKSRRKFLSLTPKKQIIFDYHKIQTVKIRKISHKTGKSMQKCLGINLLIKNRENKTSQSKNVQDSLRRRSQFSRQSDTVDFTDQFVDRFKKITSKCLSSNQKEVNKLDRNEAIFLDHQISFSRQSLSKRSPFIKQEQKTADSTPILMVKAQDQGFARRNHPNQKLIIKRAISPFTYY